MGIAIIVIIIIIVVIIIIIIIIVVVVVAVVIVITTTIIIIINYLNQLNFKPKLMVWWLIFEEAPALFSALRETLMVLEVLDKAR